MNQEVQEAKLRYENSKELFERAGRIHDRDLHAYLVAMDKAKSTPSGRDEHGV